MSQPSCYTGPPPPTPVPTAVTAWCKDPMSRTAGWLSSNCLEHRVPSLSVWAVQCVDVSLAVCRTSIFSRCIDRTAKQVLISKRLWPHQRDSERLCRASFLSSLTPETQCDLFRLARVSSFCFHMHALREGHGRLGSPALTVLRLEIKFLAGNHMHFEIWSNMQPNPPSCPGPVAIVIMSVH